MRTCCHLICFKIKENLTFEFLFIDFYSYLFTPLKHWPLLWEIDLTLLWSWALQDGFSTYSFTYIKHQTFTMWIKCLRGWWRVGMSVDDHFRGNGLRRVSCSVASLTLLYWSDEWGGFWHKGRRKIQCCGHP